jgi:Integrase core domain
MGKMTSALHTGFSMGAARPRLHCQAPRSPWENAYVERLIDSIRRNRLDHALVFNEGSLRRILQSYFDDYEKSRRGTSQTELYSN